MGLGISEDGMGIISVKKSELITAMKKNLEAHRSVFEEAQVAYRAAVIEELDKRLKYARNGKFVNIAIAFEAPQDHTKDYTRVIKMMEMCTKDEVLIHESDFAQYVMDDWKWKNQFLSNASSYTGKQY